MCSFNASTLSACITFCRVQVGLPLVTSALGLPLFDLPAIPQRSCSSAGSLDATQQPAPPEQLLPSPQVLTRTLFRMPAFLLVEHAITCFVCARQTRARNITVLHVSLQYRELVHCQLKVLLQHSHRLVEVRQAAWPQRWLPCRQWSSAMVEALPACCSASTINCLTSCSACL
jgi:hypothetical protein